MGGGLSLAPPIFALFGFSASTSFSNSRTFEPRSKTGSGFMYTLPLPNVRDLGYKFLQQIRIGIYIDTEFNN